MEFHIQFKKNLTFLILILLTFPVGINWAATYYVNNSGNPTCNNISGNGSLAHPWCTVTYGISKMQSGDTLFVMSGTYNETLYIDKPSGTASKWTVIKAYPGNVVILKGNGVNTGRIKIINSSYILFDGFRVTNYNQGIFVENSNYITIQNCEVHHVGQDGIAVHYHSHDVTIQNCIVRDTRQWQYNGEGIYIGTGSGGPPDNTGNVIIRNNVIYNNTDEGIELKPGTHDCLIEGNILYNIMTDPQYSGGGGAIEVNQSTITCPTCPNGLQTWPSNPDHVIRNNIVHSSKTGIRAGTGCMVYNNLVYNIADPYTGILVNNYAADTYTRKIYHNTVDVSSTRAIFVHSGISDIKNNIGPATVNNMASDPAFFISAERGSEDYHLVSGSAPVDAGIPAEITTDKDGNARPHGKGYDMGAYEYGLTSSNAGELFHEEPLRIYPNPLREKLFIESSSTMNDIILVEIFNAIGEKMINLNIDLTDGKILEVPGLYPGLYIIRFSNKNFNQHSKILITY